MGNFKMPKGFLWGSASAAYQVEGAYLEDGKGLTNWDKFVRIEGKTFKHTTGDVAVDHYHRFKEDIKLMAEMGLKTYRFSIAWARIIPDGNGEVNEKGLKFYEELIEECLKYNIEPMVTIFHWDLPQALVDQYNGFEDRKIVDDFVRYAKILFERFGSKVKYWITLNEQNINIPIDADVEQLTKREKEVISMLAQGASNKEIADKLFVRDVTIKTHLNAIFKKLKVTNRTQAVLLAIQLGIIEKED